MKHEQLSDDALTMLAKVECATRIARERHNAISTKLSQLAYPAIKLQRRRELLVKLTQLGLVKHDVAIFRTTDAGRKLLKPWLK